MIYTTLNHKHQFKTRVYTIYASGTKLRTQRITAEVKHAITPRPRRDASHAPYKKYKSLDHHQLLFFPIPTSSSTKSTM
jgi:hypothetical protein